MIAFCLRTRSSQTVLGMRSMLHRELVVRLQHLHRHLTVDGAATSHCQVLDLWLPKHNRRLLRTTISRKSTASDPYIHSTTRPGLRLSGYLHSRRPRPILVLPQPPHNNLRPTTTTITTIITSTILGTPTAHPMVCNNRLQAMPLPQTTNRNLFSTPHTHTQRLAHKCNPWGRLNI